jgi:2-iminobutanoate/2-iminopropanoate deaminase
MKIINTKNAPEAIGPYSQATQVGNMLFCSGQIAINPEDRTLVMDNIATETTQVMKNLFAVIEAADFKPENVVKTTIFLSDMSHYQIVNEIYGTFFTEHLPAREAVAVKTLPKNVNVEISCIAVKD